MATATETVTAPATTTAELATTTADGFACPECGARFARAQGLGAHRRTVHGIAGSSRRAESRRQAAGAATAKARPSSGPRRARRPQARSGQAAAVDRDALLRAVFPAGIPARDLVVSKLHRWLDEAEQLARMR